MGVETIHVGDFTASVVDYPANCNNTLVVVQPPVDIPQNLWNRVNLMAADEVIDDGEFRAGSIIELLGKTDEGSLFVVDSDHKLSSSEAEGKGGYFSTALVRRATELALQAVMLTKEPGPEALSSLAANFPGNVWGKKTNKEQ